MEFCHSERHTVDQGQRVIAQIRGSLTGKRVICKRTALGVIGSAIHGAVEVDKVARHRLGSIDITESIESKEVE